MKKEKSKVKRITSATIVTITILLISVFMALSMASPVMAGEIPEISIEKTVDCNDDGVFLDEDTGYAGDTAHWKVVVTNTGDSDLTNVIVTDTNSHDFSPAFDLAYGAEPVEFNYDTTVNDDTTNTATVVATDTFGGTVTDTDAATNLVIEPAICIEKTVDCNEDGEFLDTDYGYVGDTGHWRIVVTNCGDSALYDAMVTDTNGQVFGPFNLLNPDDWVQFDYDTTVNADTTNIAEVVAYDALDGTVTDTDAATNLVISPAICIEKTVDCNDDGEFLDTDYGYAGDTGHWKVIVTNCGDSDLTNVIVTDTNSHDFGDPFDLAYGAAPVEFNYDTTVNDDTTNTATVVATDALDGTVTDYDDATNDVIHPHTTLTIDAYTYETDTGWNVELTIADTNDGDVNLANCYVDLYANGVLITTLNEDSTEFQGVDNPVLHELDADSPGETWTWVIGIMIDETTIFVADGHGTDPLGTDICYDNDYTTERGDVTVEVGRATRTPGFWKTHPDFTTHVFVTYLGSHIDIGWRDITNMDDLMGIFWASTAKNADGSKRSALCQAKEQAAFQAVAAILNSALPNGAPLPVELSVIQSTLSGTDKKAIRALGATLDTYNNSGEDVALTGVPATGRADPKAAKAIANIPFADCS